MDWLIQSSLTFLQSEINLSMGLAVIAITLFVRLILFPLSFSALKQNFYNSQKMAQLKPEIDALKNKYSKDPVLQSQKLMQLYKDNGISMLNKGSILNMVAQAAVGFTMFSGLNGISFTGRFAWIADIAKSDVVLSVIVAFITGLSMFFMPSAAESVNYFMIALVSLVCVISLLNFSSVIGLYWGTSSAVTLAQSLIAKFTLSRSTPKTV